MKRYPAYKDLSLEWLEEIPLHWDFKKLKFNASVQFSNVDKKSEEAEQSVRLCNYVDVYYNNFITPDMDFMEATASPEEIRKFQLKVGDVIVTKDSEEWDDIAIPAYVTFELPDVICGYHLAQIRPNTNLIDGKFLFYFLASYRTNYQFKVEATGITRFGLSNGALSNSLMVIPPTQEQKAIAEYLDRKTVQIDDLIAKKERMIELLKEERTAVINQAVTGGLDPNVELKDSGIQWLGKIPSHWRITRLKFISPHITVGIVVEPSKYYINEGIPALRSLNIKPHKIIENDLVFISPQSNDLHSKSKIFEGDLVAVRSGQPGTTAIVDRRFHGANCIDLIIIRKPHDVASSFLDYFLNSDIARIQFDSSTGGAIQQHFNITAAANLQIFIPPREEQEEIAKFLDRKTTQSNDQIEREEKSIELLKEFRTALISEVVTGKIDVRGVENE